MKVVLSPNPYRDRGLKAALRARDILRSAGAETALCLPFALEQGSHVELPKGQDYRNMQEELKNADLLICFGGDGTILHAAKDANAHSIPILGVNLGSVGFMAELEQGELEALARLPERKYSIEHRMMLDVTVRRGREVLTRDVALNDAVITKGAVARIIDLDVKSDGALVGRFSGDGVVVATATGSTAYSMSAGGPIVEPTAENIIVSPICPHALHARSFVLDGRRAIAVKMGKLSRKTAYLSVDGGKAFRLGGSDQVELRRSKTKAKLAKLTNRSFYTVVNQKLGRM